MKKTVRVINPNEYGSLLYDSKEKNALINVIKTKRIFRYSKTKFSYADAFENLICEKFKVKYCLGIVNGTAGLVTALKAIGIKQGDRVLVSSFTYISTALAVVLCGAIPIPLEIDFKNGVNINDLETEVKMGCKAVIITHLQGRCFNLKKIASYLKEKNIYLIEDACQGFASKYNGKFAGTFGDVGVYSFQQFKQVSAGEGGAIVTNNIKIYEQARNYSDMGSVRDRFPSWNSDSCLMGENYRINQLSAAIVYEQLKKLDKMIKIQHLFRNYILNRIANLELKSLILSEDSDGDTAMNIVFLLKRASDRELAIQKLKELFNIEFRKMWSDVYFENELFKRSKLTDVNLKNKSLSYTKDVISRIVVLSIPPKMKKKHLDEIVNAINYLYDNKIID